MKKMVASSVAIPFSKLLFSSEKIKKSKKFPINFFTKPLDKYGYDFMIDTLKIAGVDGLDLTVRPKGSVLPEKVDKDLPFVAGNGNSFLHQPFHSKHLGHILRQYQAVS